jgi:REP element-mobilizing transposase RayT
MSRGDQRDDIFFDDVDRYDFLKSLAEACQKTDWQVHAFCLMRNHYHLVLETPNANLVAGMAWLQSTYTITTAEAKADRIVVEELSRLQRTQGDLAARAKSHPAKLALAARLRQETTLSVKEIAARSNLGKAKGARTNLHKFLNHTQTAGLQPQLDI